MRSKVLNYGLRHTREMFRNGVKPKSKRQADEQAPFAGKVRTKRQLSGSRRQVEREEERERRQARGQARTDAAAPVIAAR
eukprot:6194427-Pleurochrysis_carterae.AAC.1